MVQFLRKTLQSKLLSIECVGLLSLSLAYLSLIIIHRDFVPFWDGGYYYSCIQAAVKQNFSLLSFRCADHSSIVYVLYLRLTQYADPGNMFLLYLANAILAIASFVAFFFLATQLFSRWLSSLECILLTWLYACMPVLVAHLFQINLDFGLACFFVLYLSFLCRHRLWLASLFAIAMIFTKETGIAASIASSILYLVFFPPTGTLREKMNCLLPLVTPGILVMLYAVLLSVSLGSADKIYWSEGSMIKMSMGVVLDMNVADPTMQYMLADIFVLNFQWVLTLLILTWPVVSIFRHQERAPRFGSGDQWNAKEMLFCILLFVICVYAVTRFRPYNNARYVLLTYPLFVIAFGYALIYVFRERRARLMYLCTALALIFVSNFQTIDPVSRKFYGTFPPGEYPILEMIPDMHSPLFMRDEMVYNLEFMQLGNQ